MGFYAEGLQFMIDGQQRYLRSGLECFLRVENFNPQGDFQELGLQVIPAGADVANSGFTDIYIDPPPEIRNVSMHNIGLSGGKLMFGARIFYISDTFLDKILDLYPTIPSKYSIFRTWDGGPDQLGTASTIGLIYENRLWSIEDIVNTAIGGDVLVWKVTCNGHEDILVPAARTILVP